MNKVKVKSTTRKSKSGKISNVRSYDREFSKRKLLKIGAIVGGTALLGVGSFAAVKKVNHLNKLRKLNTKLDPNLADLPDKNDTLSFDFKKEVLKRIKESKDKDFQQLGKRWDSIGDKGSDFRPKPKYTDKYKDYFNNNPYLKPLGTTVGLGSLYGLVQRTPENKKSNNTVTRYKNLLGSQIGRYASLGIALGAGSSLLTGNKNILGNTVMWGAGGALLGASAGLTQATRDSILKVKLKKKGIK